MDLDSVTLAILAAVSTGLLNGTTKIAEQAVYDLYEELKSLLKQKYGEDSALSRAIESLEQEPASDARQELLIDKIIESEANRDEKTLTAANNLLAVLKTQGVAIGRDAQNNIIITGSNNTVTTIHYAPSKDLKPVPPTPLDYFVGRKEILAKIKAILKKDSKSATIAILGMGGIGKTKLAKQVAELVKNDFPGGILWGDELRTQNSDPNIILKQWIKFCDPNRFINEHDHLPSIVRSLLELQLVKSGRVLVIVDDVRLDWKDNGLQTIREALPSSVPMLITTRQKDVALEEDNTYICDLDVFSRPESCQLLEQLSNQNITSYDSDEIAKLCGDMPLALALIAGLAQKRPISWLLEQLRFETMVVLKKGLANTKEQSVKISFDVSYKALVEQYPESAQIFRSLATFSRPTFIIFKHAVSTLTEAARTEIQRSDDFWRLSDWSLLSEDKSIVGNQMQYFQMHTLLREYAQSFLTDPIEINEAIKNHRHYCVAFAQANPEFNLQIQQKSTLEFERSYGQFLEALKKIKELYLAKEEIKWKDEPALAHQVISLVEAVDHHWQLHSQFDTQIEWLQVAYACASALNAPIKQADLARRIGRVRGKQGQWKDGLKWMKLCESALGPKKSKETNTIRALMYIHRASLKYQKGSLSTAKKDCERGLDLITEKGSRSIYAEGHNLLGAIQLRQKKLSSAHEAFKHSLLFWAQIGNQYEMARVKDNIRTTLYYSGDIALLRADEEEGLQYWKKSPDRSEYAAALTNRGLVHYIDQEYETAVKLHQDAIDRSESIGDLRLIALAKSNLAWPYISLGKYDDAETLLYESLDVQEDSDMPEFTADAKRCLAEVEIGRGDYVKAIGLAETALKLAEEDDDPFEEGAALRVLGQAHYLNDSLEQAKEYLKSSLARLNADGEDIYKYEVLLTWDALYQLYQTLGDEENLRIAAEKRKVLLEKTGVRRRSSGILPSVN